MKTSQRLTGERGVVTARGWHQAQQRQAALEKGHPPQAAQGGPRPRSSEGWLLDASDLDRTLRKPPTNVAQSGCLSTAIAAARKTGKAGNGRRRADGRASPR